MDSVSVACTLLLTFIVYLAVNFAKKRSYYEHARRIPGPPSLPIIGSLLEIKKAKSGVMNYLADCQDKYGSTVAQWFGSNLYTILTDPDDIEVLLKDTSNLHKSANYRFLMPWLGEGLVTSAGRHWHTHRKILTPAFHFKITDRFLEVFNESGKILLEALEKHSGGTAFDIYDYINLYALDAIIESAMGLKMDVQKRKDSDYVKAVGGITTIAHKRSYNVLYKIDSLFALTQMGREQDKYLKTLHGLCDSIIQQRKKDIANDNTLVQTGEDDFGVKKRLAFLDLLLVGQNNGNGMTDQDIRDEVNTFMFAGHDTTTAAICFALHHLSNHSDIQQKAYEEIQQVLGDDDEITLQNIQKASYLDMVIKESMRITPSIAVISRHLDTDIKMKKYTLPAGSGAAAFIYKLHRNPEIYPEPEKFDPERFAPENTAKRHPFAYVPFSAGPRNCIGQKYAQLEVKSTLMKILRQYELLPGAPIENMLSEVVLKSTNGHIIRIRKR